MTHEIRLNTQRGSLFLDVHTEFANEMVVISGENGAGKSTLLRCIAGLEDVSGQIFMHQQHWLDSSAGFVLPIEQRKLGFVWSEAVLLPWLTIEKNIVLGVDEEDFVWFKQLVEQLEIKHLLKRKPDVLSTGEAQRVALARAIYRKPSILLLDEPFSAQAPDIRARLRQVLQRLQKQLQIPIILVSHDVEDANVLAQQHWRMREGKLMVSINRHSRATPGCTLCLWHSPKGGNLKEKKVNHE